MYKATTFKFITPIAIFVAVVLLLTPQKASAQVGSTNYYQCMGEELANYMNAVIDNVNNPNVKLLSPAFNLTSGYFQGIVGGMTTAGAKFDQLHGYAGNIYNTQEGQTISGHAASNNVYGLLTGKPIYLTEIGAWGNSPAEIDALKNQVDILRTRGDIAAALLFNPLGNAGDNPDSNFRRHHLTPDQISYICGGSCGDIGINHGVTFGSGVGYETVQSLGMSYSLKIATSGQNINAYVQDANARGITPIIRIGVGSDSGGFDNPLDYAAFLNSIEGNVLAIAGPNEPELEPWLTNECELIFETSLACEGPLQLEQKVYRTQVIGFQNPAPPGSIAAPWELTGYMNTGEHDSLDDLASEISGRLTVTVSDYEYPDMTPIVEQLVGTLDPQSQNFNIYEPNARNIVMKSPSLLYTMQIPNRQYGASFTISDKDAKTSIQTYRQHTEILYPGKVEGTAKDLGIKSEMPLTFQGCLQKPFCNPAAGDSCIYKDWVNRQPCGENLEQCLCPEGEDPENCISFGAKLSFEGTIVLNEDPEPQSVSRAYYDTYRKIVKLPNDPDRYSTNSGYAGLKTNPAAQYMANTNTVNLAQKSIQKATNGSFKTSSVYAQPMPPEQPNSQFEPGCDANGCYGVPGLQPIWDPILDLECDGSGCHPVYTVRTYEGRDCQLDHFGMTVSGAGRSGSIGRGGGAQYTAKDAAYGAGDGGGTNPLPSFEDVNVSPGQCVTINFHIEGGRSGSGQCESLPQSLDQSCTVCLSTEGESTTTCGGALPSPQPLDCRVCETWAPSNYCAELSADDVLTKDPCADGSCFVGTTIEKGHNYSHYVSNTFQRALTYLCGFASGFLDSICGGGANLLVDCVENKEDDWVDINGVPHEGDTEYKCYWKPQKYLLYAYPNTVIGNMNVFRNEDMSAIDALFKVPGVSDEYFQVRSAKAPVTFRLGLSDLSTDKSNITQVDIDDHNVDIDSVDSSFDLNVEDPNRSIYVEYDYISGQIRKHCAGNMARNLPGQFPISQYDMCREVIPELSSFGVSTSLPGGRAPAFGTSVEQAISDAAAQHNIPARLLASILAIESGNYDGVCRRNDATGATGPMQITDGTANGVTNDSEKEDWNIRSWPSTGTNEFLEDGRCEPGIAMDLGARVLKSKVGQFNINNPYSGSIASNDFATIRQAAEGYYGSCQPDQYTQGRWGANVGYCDKVIYDMGLCGSATKPEPYCDEQPITQNTNTQQTNSLPLPEAETKTVAQSGTPVKSTVEQDKAVLELQNFLNKHNKTIKDMELKGEQAEVSEEFLKEAQDLFNKYETLF